MPGSDRLTRRPRAIAPWIVLAALLAGLAAAQSDDARPGNPGAFRVENLAPGVDLYRPARSSPDHANSLVVARDDGLLVVDAQPTPRAAQDLLTAIRSQTEQPVRFLVFSHPHAVASGGADAFPRSTIRIASVGYRDAVTDPEFDYIAELRRDDDAPEADPAAALERPRATLILFGRTRLEDSRNPVILLPVAEAHSPGDLLAYLPDAGIVAAGSIPYAGRNPYANGARIGAWIGQLNHLMSMAPRRVVPVQGAATDVDGLRRRRDALMWLRRKVDDALAEGTEPDQIPAAIRAVPGFRERFNDQVRPSFLDGLIDQVIVEAREHRRNLGLE